jgi:hypothetical protein
MEVICSSEMFNFHPTTRQRTELFHALVFPEWSLLKIHVQNYSDTQLQAWSKSLLKDGWYKQCAIPFFSVQFILRNPPAEIEHFSYAQARGGSAMLDSAQGISHTALLSYCPPAPGLCQSVQSTHVCLATVMWLSGSVVGWAMRWIFFQLTVSFQPHYGSEGGSAS